MDLKQTGAFIEYVMRPFAEDIREVLDKLAESNLPLSEDLVSKVVLALLGHHFLLKILQVGMYITITVLVSHAAVTVLTHHPG